jgi:hypothetical protein
MNTEEEVYMKPPTQNADVSKRLHNLKRRCTREGSNIPRFVTEVHKYTDSTKLEDCEYYNDRLRETLNRQILIDDEVHELLDDSEYDAD